MKQETLICPTPTFTDAVRSIGVTSPTMQAGTPLTSVETAVIQELVRGRPRVACSLKQLFGPYWELIIAPRKFGLRVRRAVLNGTVPGLACNEVDSGSTKLYLLDPAAVRRSVPASDAANDRAMSAASDHQVAA